MNAETVRMWNTRYLADQAGGLSEFALKIGRSQSQMSHVIGRNPVKQIHRRLASTIEEAAGLSSGWLDTPHPDLWLRIHNPAWAEDLRRIFLQHGITVTSVDDDNELQSSLLTYFGLLSLRDQRRLVRIARAMVLPDEE